MRTDDLIDMLSSEVEAVEPHKLAREFLRAVMVAGLLALAGSVLAFGFSWTGRFENLGFLTLKVVFSLSVLGITTHVLMKHLRPGGERRAALWPTALPFLVVAGLAITELSSAPVARWHSLTVGNHGLECIVFIVLTALVPSAIIIAAARMAAPTDPVKTGALAGTVAGAMGALSYAFHCTDDSLSFIALWYVAAIVLCGVAGAVFGPRVLRW